MLRLCFEQVETGEGSGRGAIEEVVVVVVMVEEEEEEEMVEEETGGMTG